MKTEEFRRLSRRGFPWRKEYGKDQRADHAIEHIQVQLFRRCRWSGRGPGRCVRRGNRVGIWAPNRSEWLLALANPNVPKQSWAHYTVYDRDDRSQAFRFENIKVTASPTLLVQPPRTGRFGDPATVVTVWPRMSIVWCMLPAATFVSMFNDSRSLHR